METDEKKGTTVEATVKPKAERKVQLTVTMLKAFHGNANVLTHFLAALEAEPNTIAPLLFAQAVGAARQMKIKM